MKQGARAETPAGTRIGGYKLKGSKSEYRLRVGNYRVLFELVGDRIVVYTVGPRKSIYQ